MSAKGVPDRAISERPKYPKIAVRSRVTARLGIYRNTLITFFSCISQSMANQEGTCPKGIYRNTLITFFSRMLRFTVFSRISLVTLFS